jgi:hypothetical protein
MADTNGRCLRPAGIGCTVDTRAEGAGLNAQGTGNLKIAVPVWDALTRGVRPATPHRLKQAPDICFLG